MIPIPLARPTWPDHEGGGAGSGPRGSGPRGGWRVSVITLVVALSAGAGAGWLAASLSTGGDSTTDAGSPESSVTVAAVATTTTTGTGSTTTAISSVDSGGPLVNAEGEVIGLDAAERRACSRSTPSARC